MDLFPKKLLSKLSERAHNNALRDLSDSNDLIDSLDKRFVPEYIKAINADLDESKMAEMYNVLYKNLP